VLPARVSREDAAFNLGRMGLLLAGLGDHRLLSKEATEDRLHQDYRSPLFPEAPMLLSALVEAGALASCWSGAGPSLLGICAEHQALEVQRAAFGALASAGVRGTVLILHADRRGLVVGEGARLPETVGRGSARLTSSTPVDPPA
jgi:homoserine kinase